MEPLGPVYTADLFPPLLRELLGLLRELGAEDWERPTLAGHWRVRDVAAYRDGHRAPAGRPITGYRDLVGFLDELNAEGVRYARRLSPRLLVDLLAVTGPWLSQLVAELPPHAESPFAVDWAGEVCSENWMDTGREYTERWHHQMQIRDAVGASGLLTGRWLVPLLDLFVRALPRAYAGVAAAPGSTVTRRSPSRCSPPGR